MGQVRDQQQRRTSSARATCDRRQRWIALGLLALLFSGVAQAQGAGSERVLVLALVDSGVGAEATRRISSVLRTEVAAVMGPNYVEATGALATERCPLETLAACAAAKARGVSADLVVVGTVAALADAQLVDLRIIDAMSAAETARLQSPLGSTPEENRRVLRELSVRLLAPQSYVGTLVVENLAAGDRLLVDGAAVATEVPTTRLALPVGQHAIEVVYGEESRLTDVVDVGFEQIKTARVGGAESAAVATTPPATGPGWPFWTLLTVSALSTAVAVALVATYLVTDVGGQLATAEDNLDQARDQKLACKLREGEDKNAPPRYDCYQDVVDFWTTVTMLELGGAGLAGALAAGAAVAAVLLYPAGSEQAEAVAPAP